MVARIRSGKSIKGAINYNEHKVKEAKATLILAKHYHKDQNNLTFHDKLNRLQKLANLNTRATTHCFHVSLNFDPSEKLSKEELKQIATVYMEKINFGDQPYLVYEHHDAAHQHIHIVTTNITKDGKRISLHNLGKTESEKARKEIEISFGLVRAMHKQQGQQAQLNNLNKVQYGKVETKRAISNIVSQVVSTYKFASLPEFNSILKQYNIIADSGAENTRMFKNKGLQYSIIDERGKKIGVPVKASSIYNKPTLTNLESKYEANKQARQPFAKQLKDTIDAIIKNDPDKHTFTGLLKHKNIDVVFRTNSDSFIYGITYVDHNSRSVFNGSELGKQYSAAIIKEKLKQEPVGGSQSKTGSGESKTGSGEGSFKKTTELKKTNLTTESVHQQAQNNNIIQSLTGNNSSYNYIPYQLRRKRKRKKKGYGLG
jgi:hypothetical protein